MKCPKCGVENPGTNKFCSECGFNLQEFSTADRMDIVKKDIPESLVKKILLTKDTIEKERRDVTVIFVDISGSTAMSESLDPEELTLLMNDCFRKLSAMVYRYEGIIDKFIGDCVMAIFGAPVAHEDDPERAILACLDMQIAINEINARLDKSQQKLDIHSGINTGKVIAGKVGSDLQMEYTVMGDTVNVAQRLKDLASPGTILVGPETYNRTKHAFDYMSLEAVRLKGKTLSITPYEVIGKKWGSEFGLTAIRSDLIGRDTEFSKLKEGYTNLLEGQSSIYLVKGDIGIGKSRLLYEFKKFLTISDPNGALIDGRGVSYESSIPFKSFADSLKNWLLAEQSLVTDDASKVIKKRIAMYCGDEVDDVAPYLYKLLNIELNEKQLEKIRYLDSHSLQLQIFLAVATLFEKLAEERPIVYIIDDIQWIDSASLDLINFLIPLTKKIRVIFYLSYRVGELSSVRGLINTIEHECSDITTEINLKNLNPEHSVTLIDNLIGQDIPDSLRDYIIHKSGGNPFFIEEIVRSIIESGMLVGTGDVTQEIKIPGSIEAAVTSRIDSLNKEAKYLLKIASIIGRSFPKELLEEVIRDREIYKHIDELEEAEFIIKINKDNRIFYAFRHPLFHEATYDSLLKSERTIYHKVIAEIIETTFKGRIDGYYATLAQHYYNCDNVEKAREYSLRAGDEAAALYANEEALTHYNRALSVVEDEMTKAMIYEKIGDIEMLIGRIDDAAHHFHEAGEIAEDEQIKARLILKSAMIMRLTGKIDEAISMMKQAMARIEGTATPALIDIKYNLANVLTEAKAETKQAASLVEEGIEHARTIGDVKLEADGLRLKGQILWRMGKGEEAVIKILHDCQRLYEKFEEQNALAQLFILMGVIARSEGRLNIAIDYIKKAISIAKKIGHKRQLSIAYNNLGVYYDLIGDLKSSLNYHEENLAIRQQLGDKKGEAIVYYNIGTLKKQTDQRDVGMEYFYKAKEIFEQMNDVRGTIVTYLTIAEELFHLNKKDEAVEYYEKAWRIAQEKQDKILLSEVYYQYGVYFLNLKNTNKALEFFEYAKAPILEEGDKTRISRLYSSLARVYIEKEDSQAMHYAQDGLNFAIEARVKQDEVDCLKTLGRAQALVAGQVDEGIKNIKRAIALAKEKNYVIQRARGFFALGEVLIKDNKPQQALKHLERAKKIFSEFNAKFHVEETNQLIQKISR
jgi:predicted ATPase/class 3 adenylate cyclase